MAYLLECCQVDEGRHGRWPGATAIICVCWALFGPYWGHLSMWLVPASSCDRRLWLENTPMSCFLRSWFAVPKVVAARWSADAAYILIVRDHAKVTADSFKKALDEGTGDATVPGKIALASYDRPGRTYRELISFDHRSGEIEFLSWFFRSATALVWAAGYTEGRSHSSTLRLDLSSGSLSNVHFPPFLGSSRSARQNPWRPPSLRKRCCYSTKTARSSDPSSWVRGGALIPWRLGRQARSSPCSPGPPLRKTPNGPFGTTAQT